MLVVSETLWWFPWSLLAVELESGWSDAQAWLGRRRVEPTYKIAAFRPLKYFSSWIQKIRNTTKDATNVYKGMFAAPDQIPSRLLNLQFAAVLWMEHMYFSSGTALALYVHELSPTVVTALFDSLLRCSLLSSMSWVPEGWVVLFWPSLFFLWFCKWNTTAFHLASFVHMYKLKLLSKLNIDSWRFWLRKNKLMALISLLSFKKYFAWHCKCCFWVVRAWFFV